VLSKCASFHGLTTLYYAVTIEDIVVVRSLLEEGTDPTIENDS
jgi:hypothetical protein